MAQPVDLFSPLSIEGCEARLKRLIQPFPALTMGDPLCPLWGSLKRSRLTVVWGPSGRNTWKRFLTADLSAAGAGTRLQGRIAISPVALLLCLGLGAVMLGKALGVLIPALWYGPTTPLWEGFAPLILLVLFTALGTTCWWWDRNDPALIVDALKFALQATETGALSSEGEFAPESAEIFPTDGIARNG